MTNTAAHTTVLIICDDPKRAQTIHAALLQFVTPDLVMQPAPDFENALLHAGSEDVDLLLLCGDNGQQRITEIIFELRTVNVHKPVLILMPPAEVRQCLPLLDGMGAVECVHFSVVRAGQLATCVHDLCRRQRQAEDFAELSQRCVDLEAENLHLHRRLADLTRQLEEARRQPPPSR